MKFYAIPVVALFAVDASAQAPAIVPLDVKPGLWTIERTVESLPVSVRGLSATARERLIDEVRSREQPKVMRQQWQRCLTAQEVREAFQPVDEPHCRIEVVKSDARELSVNLQCEADVQRPRRDGTFRVLSESPEQLRAEIDLSVGDASAASTLMTRLTAKWFGADCSAAAPAGQGR